MYYFQKICINTNANANNNEVMVFVFIPSPKKQIVNIENKIIPIAKPSNLPGHNKPSNPVTT